tara:strand:- start:105 stop:383 length:279 start_codon:yes stop_codon:yes gene_type:complete
MLQSFVSFRFIFSGKVQGVGFRNTVLELSKSRKVYGYVKNLESGDVELRVEGDDGEVVEFIKKIRETLSGYIESVIKTKCDQGSFSSFNIVR